MQKEIELDQEKFKKLTEELRSKRKFLDENKAAEKEKEIQELAYSLQERSVRYQQELNQMRDNLRKPLEEKVRKVTTEVSKSKKLAMTFTKGHPLIDTGILYMANELDVTDDVLKLYKKKHK